MAPGISGRGGHNCCVPGCTNYHEKTKFREVPVSYMSFPNDTADDHEWREKLVAAVARHDANFNVSKHKICSDHFEKSHLVFSGKGFKISKERLPTLKMPRRSMEVTKTSPKKKPTPRRAPGTPEMVKLHDYGELQQAAVKVTEPWVLIRSDDLLTLVLREQDGSLPLKVTFNDALEATVSWNGRLVMTHELDVKQVGLEMALKRLQSLQWCSPDSERSPKCRLIVDRPGLCSTCIHKTKRTFVCEKRLLPALTRLSSAPKGGAN
ncbi:PREDICTED: uncharacterized protein LOC106816019 isoform X2 [Priapulus caudatus]|nr:PREDICTED: uncharacterized protein LOC106816019 isoform X2 [Priapulus caudatus]XP_014676044.1 PREDICTED: uncharacterized protein LOC106816019 isoform X2 [Priapulus caudatus]XP_014676045.1 PREDICTED: uncharacterized protein LOC106816019 isoform X2 [Priapulus caudatus]